MSTLTLEFDKGTTLEAHHKWLGFGAKKRLKFYEVLRVLLENRRGLRQSVAAIEEMASSGRKKPSSYALCLRAIAAEMDAGADFHEAIKPLVPLTEVQLIRSGHRTGELPSALGECIAALEDSNKMVGALAVAALYPILMLGVFYFIMGTFEKRVVPPFERLIKPELWEGPAYAMYLMIDAFRAFGPLFAVLVAGTVVLVAVTLHRDWGGLQGLRRRLDVLLPPWSIYRMMQGTAFLKTLATQVKAGVRLDSIIEEMSINASPWLKVRLESISDGLASGVSLGEAMHGSGYDFPDREAVEILRLLSTSDGFDRSIAVFATRWQESTVKRVQAGARASIVFSTLAFGALTAVLLLGVQVLSDQVEQQASDVLNRA